jgi:molybdenum cofactor cytidylyltransferase
MRNIGAVILAAGGSSRLGQPKQLLSFGGERLVHRAVRAATEAGCAPVVVVVGASAAAIGDELRGTAALVVENPGWQRGLGTSIRCGVEQLPSHTGAVVLLTCDQPSVQANTIASLVAEHHKTGKPMVASSYADTLGIPALFARFCFEALLALPDDSGAKSLIAANPDDVATVAFEAGAIDIDTPADYENLR